MEASEIAALKAKFGDKLKLIPIPADEFEPACEVVVKKPPRGEYKRFRSMSLDADERADAIETIARACVVYPDAAGFSALLEDRPALAEVVGNKVLEMAGAEGKIEAKKL
jgi:hypothetical protein